MSGQFFSVSNSIHVHLLTYVLIQFIFIYFFMCRSKKKYLLLLLAALAGVASLAHVFYSFMSLLHAEPKLEEKISWKGTQETQTSKMILMKSFPEWYEIKPGAHFLDSCDHPCILTSHDDQASQVDCIVFFTHYSYNTKLPVRRAEQIWVYFAVESPLNSYNDVFATPAWQKQFNWTMTYRRDSDFYFGYGTVVPAVVSSQAKDISAIVKGKTKMAAWFVSNCQTQSERSAYVEALQEFLPVDIYGKCGPLKCGSSGNVTCLQMLSQVYYFYLAFENSFCDDYVTEKAFEILLKADIVPVVRGGANYSAILPPHSYIDVADFSSVEDLASYLENLANSKSAYEEYFAWKKNWKVVAPMPLPLCDLCKKLHSPHQQIHVYDDVDAWWKKGRCHDPPELKIYHDPF